MTTFRSVFLTAPLAIALLAGCSGGKNPPRGDAAADTADGSVAAIIDSQVAHLPLDRIKLPPGFSIALYAQVDNARSMALSPDGTLFVGNREGDKVYAVRDTDRDGTGDKRWTIASGLQMPNGVAFLDGDLYVAEVSRVLKFSGIESHLGAVPEPTVINDSFPTEQHHGWKYIAFGPDGKLYVPVGAPCNVCERDEDIYASITRMNSDGTQREIVAHGVRNSVGFTWHPQTGELWFTDNGRDLMGDDVPPCELNRLTTAGQHFGFPYCHGGDIPDPGFGKAHACSEFVPPARRLGPHVAPLGLKFYTGEQFPAEYRGHLFIAEHGSWNRSTKIGYRVMQVKVDADGKAVSYEPFASGWLDDATQENWGRPVDVLTMPDGALLVSDDQAGVIYRITYSGT